MKIKAKFKDLILLSSIPNELEWIKKYTDMLKDDPEAEITITTQIERPTSFKSELEEKQATATTTIYINKLEVVGKIIHEDSTSF